MRRFVCLSDTHNYHKQIAVPDGDILIHAGDATARNDAKSRRLTNGLPLCRIVIRFSSPEITIGCLKPTIPFARRLLDDSIVYLQDSFVEIENLKIYGAPWQPRFYDWAFNLDRGREMAEKWSFDSRRLTF
jgi:hypothetical protein